MHVIHYWPIGTFEPVVCGADVVAVNQVEYFRQRGWTVDLVTPFSSWRSTGTDAFLERYRWAKRITLFELPACEYRFPDLYFGYVRACRQPQLSAALQVPADLFFTNYVFTAPLLDLLPPSCPRIVETHDLQAHQSALAERHTKPPGQVLDWLSRAKQDYLFRLEIELLRLYDAVLMISPEELVAVSAAGLRNALHVPPMIPVAATNVLRGGAPDTDLLFIGGDNPYNLEGIEWFFTHVYLPYLARHRVRLTVAGQVCRRLHFAARDVRLLGAVSGALSDLYGSARLVVVPILEGTGTSIKTLDAMAHGQAVVSTPVGRRGMDDAGDALICVDMEADPAQAAAVILDLLASDRKRHALGEAARAYIHRRHSRAAYYEAMDRAVAQALKREEMTNRRRPQMCA